MSLLTVVSFAITILSLLCNAYILHKRIEKLETYVNDQQPEEWWYSLNWCNPPEGERE